MPAVEALPAMDGGVQVRGGRVSVPGSAAAGRARRVDAGLAVKRPARRSRAWPLDPQMAVSLLAGELPGWEVSYAPALCLPGCSPRRWVYQATRPRPGGEESVECVYPDELVWSIDRFCEVF
ncbi:hypothetical protein GCM10023107_81900 [Actinoplanes octamycinicus]|nr:hypothetical protein Aoc01nite_36300 [Actinoplanes octamycinicus]